MCLCFASLTKLKPFHFFHNNLIIQKETLPSAVFSKLAAAYTFNIKSVVDSVVTAIALAAANQ